MLTELAMPLEVEEITLILLPYHLSVTEWPDHFLSTLSFLLVQFRTLCARFSSTYTKIGRIQRRLAWPLSKDDIQFRTLCWISRAGTLLEPSINKTMCARWSVSIPSSGYLESKFRDFKVWQGNHRHYNVLQISSNLPSRGWRHVFWQASIHLHSPASCISYREGGWTWGTEHGWFCEFPQIWDFNFDITYATWSTESPKILKDPGTPLYLWNQRK